MADEETELLKRWRAGDEGAACELLSLLKPWVTAVAIVMAGRRYGVEAEDLLQEGMRALLEVLPRFDISRGKKVRTYATVCVSNALKNCPEYTRGVSRDNKTRYALANAAHDKLMRKSDRKPTLEEIARESGLTLEEVANAFVAVGIANPIQFPEEGVDSIRRGDAVDAEAAAIKAVDDRRKLERIMQALYGGEFDEREIKVFSLHSFGELTFPEIGKLLGLKEDNAKQICHRVRNGIRKMLDDADEGEEHAA